MRLGLLRIVLRSELLESVCIESVCIPGVGNAMYIHAQSCYPILSTYPSYLCPNSQPTPRKYSNQNSRSKTKIFKIEKAASTQTPFPSPNKARQRTRPETEPKISCRVITCIYLFFAFLFVSIHWKSMSLTLNSQPCHLHWRPSSQEALPPSCMHFPGCLSTSR